jgi:broad specificity phosphatase PhoE
VSLFLLRHGQTDWNVEPARCLGWQDLGLNETGRAQARARGRALHGRGVERIVTSHLRRARETAELVREELLAAGEGAGAARPGATGGTASGREQTRSMQTSDDESAAGAPPLPIVVDPRLAETHRGRWEGRLVVEIIREEPAEWRAYREHPETFRFPGGESLAGQQRRVLAALRDVALDGRATVVVTHGGAIRLVRCFLDRRGIEAFHELATDNGGIDEILGPGLAGRVAAALLGDP